VKVIHAADLFCGAGGTSTGLARACESLGMGLSLIAVNHWDIAIKTHTANHPTAQHLCTSLDSVDPRKVVPSGHLHLLVASPECTHHSIARGGKPVSDQSRSTAWHVLRWAEALRIDSILIENVREFRDWGPIGTNGRPLKTKRGDTYRAFLNSLRSLGYVVEDRILNAANYGDPTTRERLFIIARRGRRPITWPDASHAADGRLPMGLEKWKAAREIIDWSLVSQSIFTRKRPLAPATLARIEAGLRKFGGANAEPFIAVLRRHGNGRSVDQPLPTLTAGGEHMGLCEPFVIGQQSCAAPRSVNKPLPTIATAGAISLVQPFVAILRGQSKVRSIEQPLSTLSTTGAHHALVEPFLVTANHGTDKREGPGQYRRRSHSTDKPIPTLTGSKQFGLVEPFLVPFFGERDGQLPRVHSVDDPLPTVTSHGAGGLVEPFISKYYGTGKAKPVSEPLDTITAKDRFALVTVDGNEVTLDIRFRMLQPHELARAMSFDDDYLFSGTREQRVKQIGNAVPVNLAMALCRELIA
jgi:DNA (cytosine-5)-methyltransferase 1